MATYTHKYCHNCHKLYHSYSNLTKSQEQLTGSPILTCKYCGTMFIDRDVKEPALYKKSTTLNIFGILLAPIWPFGATALLFLFCSIKTDGSISTAAAVFGVLSLIFYLYLIYVGIKNKDSINQEIKQEYNESIKRLKNKDYVIFLLNNGYKIPKRFLAANFPDLIKSRSFLPIDNDNTNDEFSFLDEDFEKKFDNDPIFASKINCESSKKLHAIKSSYETLTDEEMEALKEFISQEQDKR